MFPRLSSLSQCSKNPKSSPPGASFPRSSLPFPTSNSHITVRGLAWPSSFTLCLFIRMYPYYSYISTVQYSQLLLYSSLVSGPLGTWKQTHFAYYTCIRILVIIYRFTYSYLHMYLIESNLLAFFL